MSDYCIYCECEPVEPDGWIKSKNSQFLDEWVCPWCIKEGKVWVGLTGTSTTSLGVAKDVVRLLQLNFVIFVGIVIFKSYRKQ